MQHWTQMTLSFWSRCAESCSCWCAFIVMLSVFMLNVVMLSEGAPVRLTMEQSHQQYWHCGGPLLKDRTWTSKIGRTAQRNWLIYKTSYINEEVKCTDPSPSVSVPWLILPPFDKSCIGALRQKYLCLFKFIYVNGYITTLTAGITDI
jgi:hypothetical protein